MNENTSQAIIEYQKMLEQKGHELWSKLSSDEQIEMFCYITSKLKRAELDDKRSYRGVLYTEFGFGPEAYAAAQLSGFLELHNSIYPEGLQTVENIKKGLKLFGVEASEEEIIKRIDNEYKLQKRKY